MHRMKYLNFSVWNLELHFVFQVLFLPVALHPRTGTLTGIEQVIYRWKAAVDTQLSRVDHVFMLATVLKVFHLKFIQCSSWTSSCFRVELPWRIFVCNFLIHSSLSHKWYFFCTKLSHNKFFNFLRPRTWTYTNDFLLFWCKLYNDEIMISAFIANGNTLREVVELLVHVCSNFTLFLTCCFCTAWSSWTSRTCLFKLHFVFDVLIFMWCFLHYVK